MTPHSPTSTLFPYTTLFRSDQAIAAGMKLMFFAPDFSDPNVQSQIDAMKPYATNMLAFFMMDEPDCVANGDTNKLDQLLSTQRSEEHTSELQSRLHLVCRLL